MLDNRVMAQSNRPSKLDQLRALRERSFAAHDNGPIALYRLYDADGRLLYVGQSVNPTERLGGEHSRRFAGILARIDITWHSNITEALAAEKLAIGNEAPTHNRSPGITKTGLPARKGADGKFDRTAYQREYMRRKRAKR